MKLLLLQFNNFKFFRVLNNYIVCDCNGKLLYQCNDFYDAIDYVSNLNSITYLKFLKYRLIKFFNSKLFKKLFKKIISPLVKKNLFLYNFLKKINYYINR